MGADEHIREEWRDLGFFCKYDSKLSHWVLTGSLRGLSRLPVHIREFCNDTSGNDHRHYGPYMQFVLNKEGQATILDSGWFGNVDDLLRLADLIEKKINSAHPAQLFHISTEYCDEPKNSIILKVMEDDFDPASIDPELK